MFGFIGTRGAGSGRRVGQEIRFIQGVLGNDAGMLNVVASDVAVAITGGDDNAMVGLADDGPSLLVYMGAIWAPFPEPFDGSPLDDTACTARALLDRYQRHGEEFLDGVVGHYAVCLVDGENERLILARDGYGGPRVFVNESKNEVSFSTRLIDFAGPLGLDGGLDRALEDLFLGFTRSKTHLAA